MKELPRILIVVVAILVAWRLRRRRGSARRGSATQQESTQQESTPTTSRVPWDALARLFGATGLVATREVRERVRGRLLRVGTLLILAAVAAAIVIPTLVKGTSRPQQVGVVGVLSAPLRAAVVAAGPSVGTTVQLVPEADDATAREDLSAGRVDLVVLDARELMVNQTIQPGSTSTTVALARVVAATLGVDEAFEAAGIPGPEAARIAGAKPLPVTSLQPAAASKSTRAPWTVGLVLVFVMLTQYNTWTLIGVMEEKSSRVAEVLLAAVRPVQLLAGKVLGIGLVALAQAALIVGFATSLAEAVGSSLLQGSNPEVLVSTFVWLILGYAFYSWVYAAAGSMAERQAQVQSLAFPLTLPLIFGYIMAVTTVASGNASTFFDVLAYLPPTAPFAMPVLVGLAKVAWWQFAASVVFSVLGTVGTARLATTIYRKSILRTGRRVHLREVVFGKS